jgi:hypothetical protein
MMQYATVKHIKLLALHHELEELLFDEHALHSIQKNHGKKLDENFFFSDESDCCNLRTAPPSDLGFEFFESSF